MPNAEIKMFRVSFTRETWERLLKFCERNYGRKAFSITVEEAVKAYLCAHDGSPTSD